MTLLGPLVGTVVRQNDKLADFLEGLPGTISLSTDAADLDRHLRDFTPPRAVEHLPLAVLYPKGTKEVSQIMQQASRCGMPVVPQGGLTGMTGGAVPSQNCVALSLEKMRGVEDLDTFADTVCAWAGTPLQVVQEAAAAADRFLAVDFGSRGSCTIGGAVANNAGGNRVLRYGMMRDQVLGLEVVLADGTVITNLNKMIKNNAGYDLRNLFIGSEGTLGIVTRIVLRLFPAPRSCSTMLCAVAGIDQVHELLAMARAMLGANLSAFEVMWRDFYEVTHEVAGRSPLSPESGSHFILLEALGSNPQTDEIAFEAFAEAALTREVIADAVIARSQSDTQNFWRIRDSSGELSHLWGKGTVVNFDISVPVARVEEFTVQCRQALAEALPGSSVVFFGHVADSNMHLAVPDPLGHDRELICDTVYGVVRSLSGSVSAEHGIGLDKRKYLSFSRSEEEIALMRGIKAMLDPAGLLNPGKLLP